MKITGYYNEQGYQIESDNPMDAILYQAGNHALDSQQNGTGTEHQLSLEIIKEYCDQTTLEIAADLDAEYVGVEYLESLPTISQHKTRDSTGRNFLTLADYKRESRCDMDLQELNNRRYKIRNGTHYNTKTTDVMVTLLEHIRALQVRCRFHWGNAKTGEDWGDDCNVKGRIGRSTGSIKIPILLYNNRSSGGGAILDHCIVKITETRDGRVLYQHPKYFRRITLDKPNGIW